MNENTETQYYWQSNEVELTYNLNNSKTKEGFLHTTSGLPYSMF